MNVLMLIRPNVESEPGGDFVQLMKTRTWLERMGVTVRMRPGVPSRDEIKWADLFHLFNITHVDSTLGQIRMLSRIGKPITLSTIYWNMDECFFESKLLVSPRLSTLRRLVGKPMAFRVLKYRYLHALRQLRQHQREILVAANLLLPNSDAECRLLLQDFQLPRGTSFAVVPNGVDVPEHIGDFFQQKYGLKDFVLCVGRIEDRKNQHRLIESIAPLRIPLVLIGQPNPGQPHYYQLCQRVARERRADVTFITEYWDQERVFSAYKAARIHVLASWYDTPGLSSLEAAAVGCNIVSTDRGPTREYFGSLAWYVDPGSTASIRNGLAAALSAPKKSEQLRSRILTRFTWAAAARATLAAYHRLLADRRDGTAPRSRAETEWA